MGLAASMFSGVTGLKAHGDKMGVIGNNIANVNTLGFKGARMFFEDVISQDVPTAAGIGQVGRGVGVGAIYADFSQGGFETTGEATDLAIGGQGFFTVKKKNEDQQYYTRAGNFRFDQDGFLTDPNGLVLQGWKVERSNPSAAVSGAVTNSSRVRIVGTPTDVRLNNFQSPPQETTNVTVVANLDSGEPSRANSGTNPLAAMFELWDATQTTPITEAQYSYQSTIKVFDENGKAHDLTVYFDQVDVEDSGGKKVWEYMVTVPPAEDGRSFVDGLGNTVQLKDTQIGGVLMTGTMTFSAAGQMENLTAYTLKDPNALTVDTDADGVPDASAPWVGDDPTDMQNWTLADFSQNGYPVIAANFLGKPGLSFTNSPPPAGTTKGPSLLEINLGMKNGDLTADPLGGYPGWGPAATATSLAGLADPDPLNPLTGAEIFPLMPGMSTAQLLASATTSYDDGSATLFQSQDGYAAGILLGVSVDRDGILSGRYSNGQILELYAITLADFNNRWGLRREGSNLFSETRDSGAAITNQANHGGKGSVASNSIELSNVDLADEFVQMITTQRGFQANGKIITTTDTLLGEVINLKR